MVEGWIKTIAAALAEKHYREQNEKTEGAVDAHRKALTDEQAIDALKLWHSR